MSPPVLRQAAAQGRGYQERAIVEKLAIEAAQEAVPPPVMAVRHPSPQRGTLRSERGPWAQRQSAQSPPRVKVNCLNAVLDVGNERVRGARAPTLEVSGALLVVVGYVLRGVHPVRVPSGVLLPGALPFTGASNPAPP